ncbi:hypothetical protein EV644_10665 [Kribbella orskensis]|uniref:Uncharacterized protein n=1 Tax=Kribbella orskensis TaxID=2512216 RepID=A0ABY2BJW0_9ACTN|nr:MULTISPECIES: hypothetical protein [Kribbella]TCN40138.1 hypothetical protein EV642_10565 [Kribbella sp. VKM Ac-2500]TCO22758.1 hypothetical protein EV644_10665 [Kribbella orskensis]
MARDSQGYGDGDGQRARLRLNRLSQRRQGTNTYDLTPDGPIGTVLFPIGQRVAIFSTKVHDRLLSPLLAADQTPAPTEVRPALATIDRHVRSRIDHEHLAKAA